MDALQLYPCPFFAECKEQIGGSRELIADHLQVMHAAAYHVCDRKFLRKRGFLECKLQRCQSQFSSRSIRKLVEHLQRRHGFDSRTTYTAEDVPDLPFPPETSDDFLKWTIKPKRRGNATIPPSQSQNKPLRRAPATPDPVDEGALGEDTGSRLPPFGSPCNPILPSPFGSQSARAVLAGLGHPRLSQSKSEDKRLDDTAPVNQVPHPFGSQRARAVLAGLGHPRLSQSKSEDKRLHDTAPAHSLHENPSAARQSTSQPMPPRRGYSQVSTSLQAPRSSLPHPRQVLEKIQDQFATQARGSQKDISPRDPDQLRLGDTRRAATQSPRASSVGCSSIEDVEMADVEPMPLSLKRPRSPSPSNGSSKRSRIGSPSPSSIPSGAESVSGPFETGEDATMAALLNTSSSPGLASTGTPRPVSALPSASSDPSDHLSASLIISSAQAAVTDYRPAAPALREEGVYRSALLDKCGMLIKEKVAICVECKHGYLFHSACSHHKKHDIVLERSQKKELYAELDTRVAKSHTELRVRKFGEAPIEEVATCPGFACDRCEIAWMDKTEADKHFDGVHSGRSEKRECEVQSLLHPQFKPVLRWVRVDPMMGHGGDSRAAYDAFQATWGAKLRKNPLVIPGPINDKGNAILANVTGWLIHLKPFITTTDDVASLRSLTDNRRGDVVWKLAKEVVEAYFSQGVKIVHAAEAHVRYLLSHCPRTADTKLFRIPTSDTVEDYARNLAQVAIALMRSIGSEGTKYRFPLTVAERKRVSDMQELLTTELTGQARSNRVQELVPKFHDFIKVFLMKREGPVELRSSKFGSVLECFLAVLALRDGGILCTADSLTGVCASLKFSMRICVAFEGKQLSLEKDAPAFHEIIMTLGMQHLNLAERSEFTRITDNASLLAKLVYTATEPANLHVSSDFMSFTYLKTTVNLAKLRLGIQQSVMKLQGLLHDLEMGISVPLKFPEVWVDTWTTEAAGESFLSYNEFFDEKVPKGQSLWLNYLIASKGSNLILLHEDGSPCHDSHGDVLFNSVTANTILSKNKAFLQRMMVMCFLACTGCRAEEFVEFRGLNGGRPRSFLVSMDGECTLSPRRIKTEGVTMKKTFIPSLVPPELAELLLRYLIIVRPGINNLIRIRTRDGPEAIHQAEFLWAIEGRVPTGDELGCLLQAFTRDECGAEINRSSWRQIITEMMRVYSTHQLPNEETEGISIHDARMGRSSKTSHQHYGSKDANMATDELLNFRDASLELHQLLGLGPEGKSMPIARRVRERQSKMMAEQPGLGNTSTCPSLQQIAAVVSNMGHEMMARMENIVARSVPRAVVDAMTGLGVDERRYSAHSPGLEPLDTFMQPTEYTEEVRPVVTPTSDSILMPIAATSTSDQPDAILLDKLQAMLGKSEGFKSSGQRDALRLALDHKTSFLALLQPGEGKSLLYQLPAFHKKHEKTIVVCPRSILLRDQMNRAEALQIPSFHWTSQNNEVPPETRLIFVALESLKARKFHELFNKNVTRVALDEIHEFSTAGSWRPSWAAVQNLIQAGHSGVQFLLLSGSVKFGYESRLIRELGFKVDVPVVRSPIQQPNHQFLHLRLGRGQKVDGFLQSLEAKLAQVFMKPGDQGIIFYPTVAAIESMAQKTCASWKGWGKRETHETEWLAGKHTFIHATTTCSVGIDNGRCNVIVFVDFLPGLVNILQCSARGGRRGQQTLVIFITSHGYVYPSHAQLEGDPECICEGAQMLNGHAGCFRSFFGRAFNGREENCVGVPNAAKCQRCAPTMPLFTDLERLVASIQNAGPSLNGSNSHQRHAPYLEPATRPRNGLPAPRAVAYNAQARGGNMLELHVAQCQSAKSNFPRQLAAIANLSELLEGHCGACWALTGRRFTNGHPVFGPCSLDRRKPSNALDNKEFLDWEVDFRDHTACFSCYMPQVKGPDNLILYARHPVPGGGRSTCTHPRLFKVIAWAVLKTPDLVDAFKPQFSKMNLTEITPQTYAKWLAKETDGMVNIGHLVLWLTELWAASGVAV